MFCSFFELFSDFFLKKFSTFFHFLNLFRYFQIFEIFPIFEIFFNSFIFVKNCRPLGPRFPWPKKNPKKSKKKYFPFLIFLNLWIPRARGSLAQKNFKKQKQFKNPTPHTPTTQPAHSTQPTHPHPDPTHPHAHTQPNMASAAFLPFLLVALFLLCGLPWVVVRVPFSFCVAAFLPLLLWVELLFPSSVGWCCLVSSFLRWCCVCCLPPSLGGAVSVLVWSRHLFQCDTVLSQTHESDQSSHW